MINKLRVNHLTNPYGIDDKNLIFSFVADEGKIYNFNLYENNDKVYGKKVSLCESVGFNVDYHFENGKKYTWSISYKNNESKREEFLIADKLDAPFIGCEENLTHPEFYKEFSVEDDFIEARLVITGLGLYTAYLNDCRIGHNYLTPGFNDYDCYLRYQEYDITSLIKKNNKINVILGDGWYKGRIGFDNHPGQVYGNKYLLSAKIIIRTNKGIKIIKTDETWKYSNSIYEFSTIYDGEIANATSSIIEKGNCHIEDVSYNLRPQGGTFITIDGIRKAKLITTPKGKKILDFGQNMVGFVRFVDHFAKGTKLTLKYGEVLHNSEFYNDNLRSAKQEFIYTCGNTNKEVEALFTYYGFRYVLVEGLENVDINDFDGVTLTSKLDKTISIKTNNKKINQLISNAYWGQKDNFMDVPTDCPQRDERLGWTADTQVFASTACFNMFSLPFYQKYLDDLRDDQLNYFHGNIPAYSPSLKGDAGLGGAVWSDCATIIPWKLYVAYGDKRILEKNYPLMKDYVDTLIKHDVETGNKHLVLDGFTFGDWLAQDGITSQSLKGGTDDNYIQSVYYYVSVSILVKTCKKLRLTEDEAKYSKISKEIKRAILNEYFSKNGRLTIDTQTGYILALYYDIYINKEKVIDGFKKRLEKDLFKLKSGFTGTPLALLVLFDNGLEEEAYRILFNEESPSWLYAINLGATTIWERWNSLLEDGTISGTSMNSLNHYAYGSVCEAIYTRIAGMKPIEAGFRKVLFEPKINYRLTNVDMSYDSVIGKYHIDYNVSSDNFIDINIVIPHGGKGLVRLPYSNLDEFELEEGSYHYHYLLSKDLIHPYSMNTRMIDLMNDPRAIKAMEVCPIFIGLGQDKELGIKTPSMLANLSYLPVGLDQAKAIDIELKKIIFKGE